MENKSFVWIGPTKQILNVTDSKKNYCKYGNFAIVVRYQQHSSDSAEIKLHYVKNIKFIPIADIIILLFYVNGMEVEDNKWMVIRNLENITT